MDTRTVLYRFFVHSESSLVLCLCLVHCVSFPWSLVTLVIFFMLALHQIIRGSEGINSREGMLIPLDTMEVRDT